MPSHPGVPSAHASFLSVPGARVPTLSLALIQERQEEEAVKHCLQSWAGCGHPGVLGEQGEEDRMGLSLL